MQVSVSAMLAVSQSIGRTCYVPEVLIVTNFSALPSCGLHILDYVIPQSLTDPPPPCDEEWALVTRLHYFCIVDGAARDMPTADTTDNEVLSFCIYLVSPNKSGAMWSP